jgi:hypothetical protein
MWDDRLAEVCRQHPDLVAVYESSRGRLGLLLRQTLVPLAAEQMEWLRETRTVARAINQDFRAAGFAGATLVLQWLPIEDVARIVARWVRRWDGDRARRSELLAVVERRLADQRFLASVSPADSPAPRAEVDSRAVPETIPTRRAGFDETGLAALKAWYETMAPCWLAIQPARRRRLVLQTHVWLADVALGDPIEGPGRALAELGPQGSLVRALQRHVPGPELGAWRPWIEYVRVDLLRSLGRPAELRTQAWARWLFFIPYAAPAPRSSRRPRTSPWTSRPWREKMNA